MPLHVHFSSSGKRTQLLGIAHLVVGTPFTGTEGALGDGTHPRP